MRVLLDQGPEISRRIGISPIHGPPMRDYRTRPVPASYVPLRPTVKSVLMSLLPAEVSVRGTILDVSASWAWSAKGLLPPMKARNAKVSGLTRALAAVASRY
jgi:hypothetical protein